MSFSQYLLYELYQWGIGAGITIVIGGAYLLWLKKTGRI